MRVILAAALVAMASGAAAIADDKTPAAGHNGLTIGHDGKMWRMEGCAAYPVEAEAGGQSKPVATITPAVTPKAPAGEVLAKTDKPTE